MEKYIVDKCEKTCYVCPSQWDIYTKDGKYIYVRYRWGRLTVDLNAFTPDEVNLLSISHGDPLDGFMKEDELKELTKDILEWK